MFCGINRDMAHCRCICDYLSLGHVLMVSVNPKHGLLTVFVKAASYISINLSLTIIRYYEYRGRIAILKDRRVIVPYSYLNSGRFLHYEYEYMQEARIRTELLHSTRTNFVLPATSTLLYE
eukprot:scaffold375750_cov43-Prasinocladus_malaysianus.AAC.1